MLLILLNAQPAVVIPSLS